MTQGILVQVTDDEDFVVIDRTTGTVLGSGVVVVRESLFTNEEWENISSSDSTAREVASKYGSPLFVKE